MNRKLRIIGGCSIAACLLWLLPSCATTPGIALETARKSLQTQYPDLLRSFDLHQGVFAVSQAAWDGLTPEARAAFLQRCSQARHDITGRTKVDIQADGNPLAAFDGSSSVFYGLPSIARTDQEVLPAEGAESNPGSAGIPVLLWMPRPVYPVDALRAGIEGTVMVQARVAPDGSVSEIALVGGGIEIFNSAATEAARQARFQPFLATDQSESVWVRIPMHFSVLGTRQPAGSEREAAVGGLVNAVEPAPDRSARGPGASK